MIELTRYVFPAKISTSIVQKTPPTVTASNPSSITGRMHRINHECTRDGQADGVREGEWRGSIGGRLGGGFVSSEGVSRALSCSSKIAECLASVGVPWVICLSRRHGSIL